MISVVAFVAFVVTCMGENAVHAAVWHVPLARHDRSGLSTKATVWEPTFPTNALAASTHHPPVPVDFRDISKNLFATKLFLGTPPQPVSLGFDISSADILVFNHKIGHHHYYNHSKSSTYQANGTQVKFFEGMPIELDGFVSSDYISLGGTQGGDHITVRDQSFVEVTGPDKTIRNYPPKLDGFISVGRVRANSTGKPSIMRTMIDQQLLDRPVLGLGFEEVVAHAIFGGIDPSYKPTDFHYYPQRSKMGWTVPMSAIHVDGKRVIGDIGDVMISLADLVIGPTDQIDALAEAVGAESYELPCDSPSPDIVFQLADGFQVRLTKKDYTIPLDQGWCHFAFVGQEHMDSWIFGLSFLSKVYTVLDFGTTKSEERLGLALLKP